MSDIFGSLLGAASNIGAAAVQPAPSAAYRGTDFNPVTNINAPGAVDFKGLSDLLSTIQQGVTDQGVSFFNPGTYQAVGPVQGGGLFSGIGSNGLLLLAVVGIVGIIIWRKYGA